MSEDKSEKKDLLELRGKYFISREHDEETKDEFDTDDKVGRKKNMLIPPAEALAPSRLSSEYDDFIA